VGAGGDKDFGLGVVGERVVALLLRGNGVAQAVNAVEAGVDVVAGVNGRDGFGLDRRGHGGVADALGQVDAAMASQATDMARISDWKTPGASWLRARRDGAEWWA